MAGRSYKTEAVVLRSFRLGEADRVLHLYTLEHGRVGAVAKGVRKTKSRFGARLEPLSHGELMLHHGSGELQTVTGVQLVRAHHAAREDYYRLSVGLIGAEAMLRLFSEQEANARAFTALTRFLDLLDETPHAVDRPALDPLGLSFQLKLLWLSGYLPHLTSCAECGAEGTALVGYSPRAGGAVCAGCAGPRGGARASAPKASRGSRRCSRSRSPTRSPLGLSERARRDALRVVTASYEYHGGFRLTDVERVKRELGEGFELDDDPVRLDREAVHAYLGGESYWAKGRPRERQDELIDASARVVGLYRDGAQVGFARAVDCDAAGFMYLADVYVLEECRGLGLGLELVRELVENGPYAGRAGSCTRATCTASTRSSASARASVAGAPPQLTEASRSNWS